MAAGVESQLITYAKHHSKGMHIKIDVFLLTQWKNRLAVVRGIVERKNLLGYRMEGTKNSTPVFSLSLRMNFLPSEFSLIW